MSQEVKSLNFAAEANYTVRLCKDIIAYHYPDKMPLGSFELVASNKVRSDEETLAEVFNGSSYACEKEVAEDPCFDWVPRKEQIFDEHKLMQLSIWKKEWDDEAKCFEAVDLGCALPARPRRAGRASAPRGAHARWRDGPRPEPHPEPHPEPRLELRPQVHGIRLRADTQVEKDGPAEREGAAERGVAADLRRPHHGRDRHRRLRQEARDHQDVTPQVEARRGDLGGAPACYPGRPGRTASGRGCPTHSAGTP